MRESIGGLTKDFIAYADSLGTQRCIILSPGQIEQLRSQATEEVKGRFDLLDSDDFKELDVAVIVGVFGYDDIFADFGNREPGIGLTGIHQNYWQIADKIGKELLSFLKLKGFKAKFNGEGILPIKHVLNRLRIGQYGKNSLIYIKDYGSYNDNWVELFTNAPLQPIKRGVAKNLEGFSMCDKCNACMTRCPTRAIYEPYKVDLNKCICNLTHRVDRVPKDLFDKVDNWIWGCDKCQNVCPGNAKVTPRKRHPDASISHPGPGGRLPPAHKNPFPKLAMELVEEYDTKYLQNVLIALGNSGKSEDIEKIEVFSRTKKGLELTEYCEYAMDRVKNRRE